MNTSLRVLGLENPDTLSGINKPGTDILESRIVDATEEPGVRAI
jgi:hypothetical protein